MSAAAVTRKEKLGAKRGKSVRWGVEATGSSGATATLFVYWEAAQCEQRRTRLAVLHRIAAAACELLEVSPCGGTADPQVVMGDAQGRVVLELMHEKHFDAASAVLASAVRLVLA